MKNVAFPLRGHSGGRHWTKFCEYLHAPESAKMITDHLVVHGRGNAEQSRRRFWLSVVLPLAGEDKQRADRRENGGTASPETAARLIGAGFQSFDGFGLFMPRRILHRLAACRVRPLDLPMHTLQQLRQ